MKLVVVFVKALFDSDEEVLGVCASALAAQQLIENYKADFDEGEGPHAVRTETYRLVEEG